QQTIVLDREHDCALLAVTGDGLRAFGTRALDHFAKPCFCILDLPHRHPNDLSALIDRNIVVLVEIKSAPALFPSMAWFVPACVSTLDSRADALVWSP